MLNDATPTPSQIVRRPIACCTSIPSSSAGNRSPVIFAEPERGRRRDEEPYSCTVTIPDGGIAKVSAKSTGLLCAEEAGYVSLFPRERPFEVPELLFAFLVLRRMQVDAAEAATSGNHVMEHLVVDDVGDEVAGDPSLVERRMNANQAVDRAVAAELDRSTRLGVRRRSLAPCDEGVDRPAEVVLVQLIE